MLTMSYAVQQFGKQPYASDSLIDTTSAATASPHQYADIVDEWARWDPSWYCRRWRSHVALTLHCFIASGKTALTR